MGKTKSIVFQFFQIVLQKEFIENNQIVWRNQNVFDFADWLRIQDQEGNIKKNILVNGDFLGNLEQIANSSTNPEIIFARFFKLRDMVPAKVKDGIGAESIDLDEDEYIGEDVSILYDNSNGVCMLQRNRFSLSYLKIEEWLSMSCEIGYRVKLKPISDTNVLRRLNGKNIRSFDVSFANISYDLDGIQNDALNRMMRSVQYFEGKSLNIKVSVGREKHKKLNNDAINALLDGMNTFRSHFTKAKITLSDNNDSNVEILDLLDAIMSGTINVTVKEKELLNFKNIAKKMESMYDRKKEELLNINIFPR